MFEMTTLCYIEKDGKYLMLHRVKKKNDANHDKWIGVGGHFEANESPEECMKREVFEETGLNALSWSYRGIVTFVFNDSVCEYMHLFTVDEYEGEVTDCNEGTLEWVDKEKLSSLPMWEGDNIFLSLINGNEPFFSLKLCYHNDTLINAVLNGKKI